VHSSGKSSGTDRLHRRACAICAEYAGRRAPESPGSCRGAARLAPRVPHVHHALGSIVWLGRARQSSACRLVRRLSLLAAPCAVALSAILAIYYSSGSPIEGTYRPIAVAVVLVLATEAVLIPVVGWCYAALVTSVLVLAVFKEWGFVGGALAVTALVAVWSWRRRRLPATSSLEQAIRLPASLLFLATIGVGVAQGALGLPTIVLKPEPVQAGPGRDIIVVLLDGYARSDTLATAFGFDNGPFHEELEERGFEIAERSRSNYPNTALTHVSMFQMRHIADVPPLPQQTRHAEGYRAIGRIMAGPLPVLETMRRHDYETIHITPVVNEFKMHSADRVLDSGQMVQLETVLLGRTLLGRVVDWVAPDLLYNEQRERSLQAVAAVETLALDSTRQFVFAHLMLPHSPYVFGPNGEPLPQPDCLPVCTIFHAPPGEESLRLYRDQLSFTNTLMLEMVDTIRSGGADPVIVLMSDHGSRLFVTEHPEEFLLNFFASATPGRPGLFPDDATPVNLFPRLFRAYLNEEIDLLPERFFLPSGGESPTDLKPVD
jgi:hypothetical protein